MFENIKNKIVKPKNIYDDVKKVTLEEFEEFINKIKKPNIEKEASE